MGFEGLATFLEGVAAGGAFVEAVFAVLAGGLWVAVLVGAVCVPAAGLALTSPCSASRLDLLGPQPMVVDSDEGLPMEM